MLSGAQAHWLRRFLSLNFEQSLEHCLRDHMRPVPGAQLQSNRFQMAFDRARRDPDLNRDLLCRKAVGHEFQYFLLSMGEHGMQVDIRLRHNAPKLLPPPRASRFRPYSAATVAGPSTSSRCPTDRVSEESDPYQKLRVGAIVLR